MKTAQASTGPRVQHYATGELIEDEGSTRFGWYVLLEGSVGVFKADIQVATFATRGAVFGEISSILRQPRSARLIALEPTTVMVYDTDLDQLITQHPKVAKTMLISLAERLVETTDALWSARGEA